MGSQPAVPLHGSGIKHPAQDEEIPDQTQGTVTIINTGGVLGLTGSGTGWEAQGSVITFAPAADTIYVLTLQPPQDWTWNSSAALEVFHGDDNLCGFYSNETTLRAFNGTDNQAPQVLKAIFNLEDQNNLPSPFTVFLHFPAGTEEPEEEESAAQAVPIPTSIEDEIPCTAIVDGSDLAGIEVAGSGRGWSTSNPDGGQINLKPISDSEGTTTTWDLTLNFAESLWILAGSSPTFEVYFELQRACGVAFMGPKIKAYNYLPPGGTQQTFTLALKLTDLANLPQTQWIDDPSIVFDPQDPPT